MTNKVQTVKYLLKECSSTIKRYDEYYKQTGEKYNIFKITNISSDEVKMCKVIGDLLNPNGNHGKGDYFLKCFIDTINEKISSPLILNSKNAQVKNEYYTNINCRIDIVIKDGNIFIPIEVKINARDQEEQVSHYFKFSKMQNKDKDIPVIYLTKEGKPPSNARPGEYIPISFKHDILKWLNKCIKNTDEEKTKPVFAILKQLITSIKSICGISEDEKMEKAIQELIVLSEDNFKTALTIKQAVESLLTYSDEKSWELFSTKILSQIKNTIPEAGCDEKDKWRYMYIPIKNGNYLFSLNYDWKKICIEIGESNYNSTRKDEIALSKKMEEETRMPNKNSDDYIWLSDKYSYPRFSNTEHDLYFYKLQKDYLENTTEVVSLILNFVEELNKA